jgi:hypothetical protein
VREKSLAIIGGIIRRLTTIKAPTIFMVVKIVIESINKKASSIIFTLMFLILASSLLKIMSIILRYWLMISNVFINTIPDKIRISFVLTDIISPNKIYSIFMP